MSNIVVTKVNECEQMYSESQSDKVLGIGAFQGILNKMIKRLDPWKGKFMT
jgi:hypothetical protein